MHSKNHQNQSHSRPNAPKHPHANAPGSPAGGHRTKKVHRKGQQGQRPPHATHAPHAPHGAPAPRAPHAPAAHPHGKSGHGGHSAHGGRAHSHPAPARPQHSPAPHHPKPSPQPTSEVAPPTASPSAPRHPDTSTASTTFAALHLAEPILRAVTSEGYTTPTPIQAQTIPLTLQGRDVLGCAQTGTGKTAAFALPILHRLSREHIAHPNQHQHRPIRALILAPTRELALQIEESFRTYGRHAHLRSLAIFGGVNQNPQTRALRQGVDILIATPGRLMDLMQQGYIELSRVEVFVLDEADRMLDMGFIDPIRRIAGKTPPPGTRQTLLFSATMPKEIRHLAEEMLRDPARVEVAAVASTPDRVEQSVYMVDKKDKPALLAHFIAEYKVQRALVFTRTKHGADRVARDLARAGITADAIHGNKRQNVRQRTLEGFRSGRIRILVATDIAARGIDVDGITHVVNFDVPHEPETYVHRIGRTARAGAKGQAVSFVDRHGDERGFLKSIERLIRKPIEVRPPVENLPPPPPRSERPHHAAHGAHPSGPRHPNARPARSAHPRRSDHSGGGHGGGGHASGAPHRSPLRSFNAHNTRTSRRGQR